MPTYLETMKEWLRDMKLDSREYPSMTTTCTAGVSAPTYYFESVTKERRQVHYHAARIGRRWK